MGSDPGIFSWVVLRLFLEPRFPHLQNTIKHLLQNVVELKTHVEYELMGFLSTCDLLMLCFAKDKVWGPSGQHHPGPGLSSQGAAHSTSPGSARASATEQDRGGARQDSGAGCPVTDHCPNLKPPRAQGGSPSLLSRYGSQSTSSFTPLPLSQWGHHFGKSFRTALEST